MSIIITIMALICIFIFFFSQGAVVMVGGLEGNTALWTQGIIIWSCTLLAMAVCFIKEHSLEPLGYRKPVAHSSKSMLYFIPLIVVALLSFGGGVKEKEFSSLCANLFLTLGVGFTEETYFRGIICRTWMKISKKKAVVISTVLFGVVHMMNIMGGAGITETLLQICFAMVYGVVMAMIFIKSESIWPCILLHAFHDFCGFITEDGSMKITVIIGVMQFAILLIYCIHLGMKNRD